MLSRSAKAVTALRATLEGFAARHAAERVARGAETRKLLDCFRRMQVAKDYAQLSTVDQELHHCLVELADIPGLENAWREVFKAQNTFRLNSLKQCWPDFQVLIESHRSLVDAIASGDASAAEQAAIAHLDAVWFRLDDVDNNRSLPHNPLMQARAYLAFHFHEPIRLTQLADRISGCSAGHLARLFRDEIGLSFSDYLIDLRMQKASELLQCTQISIQEVAARVGYRDPSRFAVHFRRQFHKTPQDFRGQASELTHS